MSLLAFIGNKILRAIAKIPIYEEVPLDTFNEISAPIISKLASLGFEVPSKPHTVVSDPNVYTYYQSAKKRSSKCVVRVTWHVEADTLGKPYPVLSVYRYIHSNLDKRNGVASISIEYIYSGTSKIAELVQQVEDHPIQFFDVS